MTSSQRPLALPRLSEGILSPPTRAVLPVRVHSAEATQTQGRSVPDKALSCLAGIILFTASAGGLFPMPVDPPYAAAKAGLINFALSITPPLAAWGIRVCSLCPQPVDTPMVSRHLKLSPSSQAGVPVCASQGKGGLKGT